MLQEFSKGLRPLRAPLLALTLTLLPNAAPRAARTPRAQDPPAAAAQEAAPKLTDEALAARLKEKAVLKLEAEKVVVAPAAKAALEALIARAARRVVQDGASAEAVSRAETGILYFVESMISRATKSGAPTESLSENLSGTYEGTVDLPDAVGAGGPATLTIEGKQFTLAQAGKRYEGRITVTSTEGYLAATLVFDGLRDPASNTPLTASVRARVTDNELALTPVPGVRNDLLFLPEADNKGRETRITHDIYARTALSICPLYPFC